ncbi:aminotransferase, class V superfamily [Synechococcus sp. PCC 7335]|uniref:cysteine desulfurase family protein n=1 Tax=Synechococcus sp. (strain ATCC 29403 / PCC 7335) TaxID=91464 RepID=UPI00017ECB00|nr:IscS subfamily cysteine desulfurase [Synechococcus sp. PCC 7335]EDX85558.1 aminotransferase, class V superfamily [Synechococcus sp. PCC 7335]
MSRPIYLDCNATTPVDPQVLSAMLPFFTDYFGNPSSLNHSYGWEAEASVGQARKILAEVIAADPVEIVFTSGATEANNLAIKGVAESYMSTGRHLITVQTEHSAVLEPCRYLETLGFEITYLSVQPDGLVELQALADAFRPDTILVSVMTANNEIGVLQPIKKIGEMCRERGVLFHTDAAQAVGKIPLNVDKMHIDLLSMTAHKLYGPKGIGALYVRRKNPRVQISPQLHGGGQERGIRSGTLYPPQIVGFGEAVRLAVAEMETETQRLKSLRDRLWQHLQAIPGIYLNGHPTRRLPNNLNISFDGIDGNALLLEIRDAIAISSGSACSSLKAAPSHVIQSLGRSHDQAKATLRFGLGRHTSLEEIERAATIVRQAVRSQRQTATEIAV